MAASKPDKSKTKERQPLKALHVLELGVENYMRVRAVRIRPTGRLTEITGRNRQGKSSVLDALMTTIAGRGELKKNPIREGEPEATTYVDLGDGKTDEVILRVEQRLTRREGAEGFERTLHVRWGDKRVATSPQDMLDTLYERVAFDPMEFLMAEPKERSNMLKALVPGFDFAANAKDRAEAYTARTDVGRDRDRAKAQHDGVVLSRDCPTEAVDLVAMARELTEANAHNAGVSERVRRRDEAQQQVEEKRDEAERLRARAATLDKEATELEVRLAKAEALPPTVDVQDIQRRIGAADAHNRAVQQHQAKQAHHRAYMEACEGVSLLTAEIDALDKAKAAALAGAKLPVAGLGLGDDDVTLNGLPLDQASTREQVTLSTSLAMALNPEIRVVVIRNWPLCDQEGRALIMEMAAARDFDVWVEKVTEPGEGTGFVIEDGEVAS